MSEDAVMFGTAGRLSGILGSPASEPLPARPLPTVVFLSAGLLHRVGPYRLYVELARHYNQLGFATLRFDLGGIGDSRAAPGGSTESAAQGDVTEAMDWLEAQTGATRFILCGLCSGAETAHRAAVHDSRVVGILALEGHIFPTPAYYLWHYLPRILSWRKWILFLPRLLQRSHRVLRRSPAPGAGNAELWSGQRPTRDAVAQELQRLCDRGVQQLLIFAGGTGDCSYAGQFRRAFRDVEFRDCLETRFLPDADHMYILRRDREALFALLERWMLRCWLAPRPAASPQPTGAAATPSRLRDPGLPSRELP